MQKCDPCKKLFRDEQLLDDTRCPECRALCHPLPKPVPVKMICASCGSDQVMKDAWAVWDVENQMWVLGQEFDDAHCDNCDSKTSLIEKPLETTDAN